MIYSAYLDSNVISVCSVFSQFNYISLFIVLQKCQIFKKYLILWYVEHYNVVKIVKLHTNYI
jgi:hypothetical protein